MNMQKMTKENNNDKNESKETTPFIYIYVIMLLLAPQFNNIITQTEQQSGWQTEFCNRRSIMCTFNGVLYIFVYMLRYR